MGFESKSTAVLNPPDDGESSPVKVESFFVHTATLEFQATLQLLLERARFLTAASGAAVALHEDGHFIYSAAAGESAAESGAPLNLDKKYLSDCVRLGQTVRTRTDLLFALAVPILCGVKVAGVVELLGHSAFEDRDAEAAVRLAEMASTAIEHRNAAVQAENVAVEDALEPPPAPLIPSLWHAPDIKELPAKNEPGEVESLVIQVHKCSSCGFPVSHGRQFCVDCEKNADVGHEPAELFSTPPQESWIDAHGYTIASILVSAIVICVIIWLRAR